MKRDISIDVAGQTLTIRSDEDEAYVRALATFVDRKVQELGRGQHGVTTLNLALTAALTIADELHKLRKAQEDIDGDLDRLSARIEGSLTSESL